ncbi:MAG TPA: ABC transporter permease [Candidatus Acidoferrales bacterium]|nr:ABC transporter permease [Candidatus Acidoferrales bacterium]
MPFGLNFERTSAIIERDMRKFFRSPALMVSSMVFPLMQLIVLGYAFGGKIKGLTVALVDEDRSSQSRIVRERFNAIAAGPQTFHTVEYDSLSNAVLDLRAGFVRAVVHIPHDYSRRVLHQDRPRIAFIEDNTDNFVSGGLLERVQQIQADLNAPIIEPRLPGAIDLQIVEVYPYIEYIKYLLAGSVSIAIFVVAMIGGGIVFIDDKARGLHEGYLVTPIHKAELILGLNFAGAIKGLMSGLTITIIGGLIAGIDRIWDPVRLFYLLIVLAVSSLAMISFMFLVMVRVNDPLVPRAIFGVLNTLLFFPSGAIYPTAGFPVWLKWISVVDPFTYVVHALKNLLLKNTGFEGIYFDVLVLAGFSVVLISACIALFKRQI